jgi:hypothetical protein
MNRDVDKTYLHKTPILNNPGPSSALQEVSSGGLINSGLRNSGSLGISREIDD